MDPDATLEMLLSAIEDKDWEAVAQYAIALHEWIKNGGFPPETVFTLI